MKRKVYHATHLDHLPSIAERGLVPWNQLPDKPRNYSCSLEDVVYVTTKLDRSGCWGGFIVKPGEDWAANEPHRRVVLRAVPVVKLVYDENFCSKERRPEREHRSIIPPEHIEVKVGKRYVPIRKYCGIEGKKQVSS